MPPTGSQPVRAAAKTRKSDVSSGGMDSSRSDAARIGAGQARRSRRLPVTTPSGRPMSVAARSAVIERIAVLAARSGMRSATGRSKSSDCPKSKRAAPASQARYCSPIDRSRP